MATFCQPSHHAGKKGQQEERSDWNGVLLSCLDRSWFTHFAILGDAHLSWNYPIGELEWELDEGFGLDLRIDPKESGPISTLLVCLLAVGAALSEEWLVCILVRWRASPRRS
jgi:hypothetical protein